MQQKINHEEFFRSNGERTIRIWYFGDMDGIEVEELYQVFKARMEKERREEK